MRRTPAGSSCVRIYAVRIERVSLLSLGWANVARDVQMPKGLLVVVASEMDRILTSGEAQEIKAGGF
jgi:hypothetical protein